VRRGAVLAGLAACAFTGASAAERARPTAAALVEAARSAPLKLIDALQVYCDGETRIDDWLKALTKGQARAIQWSGGACNLTDDQNPLDAKSWPYCADAAITLNDPKSSDDKPVVEIYLETPVKGRPGAVYAFRAMMLTPEGGDYARSRKDFETDWKERFPPPAGASGCEEP
jgi:hypothetical protein